MTFGLTLALGALVMIVLLGATEAIARAAGGSFVESVVIGSDDRTSTSKTFILVWTLLVGWALVSFVIAGEVLSLHACAAGSDLDSAAKACSAIHDKVGLLQVGWRRFISSGLAGSYLLLLGIPASAGVAAKVITQTKVSSGTIAKPPAMADSEKTVVARLAQVFSADDQTTDIGDFQYVIFNLITAAYFIAHVIRAPGSGLPPVPDTLLGLTSVSAGLYVAKKAADRSKPAITGVFPSMLLPASPFTITGSGLTADAGAPATADIEVRVNGLPATSVLADPTVADRITAVAPGGLVGSNPPSQGTVQVSTAYGAITDPFPVLCGKPPAAAVAAANGDMPAEHEAAGVA